MLLPQSLSGKRGASIQPGPSSPSPPSFRQPSQTRARETEEEEEEEASLRLLTSHAGSLYCGGLPGRPRQSAAAAESR